MYIKKVDSKLHINEVNKKSIILLITFLLLVLNIGISLTFSYKNISLFKNNNLTNDNLKTNIDEIINPPLGNQTVYPSYQTFFSILLFIFPIELSVIFLSEFILYNNLEKMTKKRISFLRLLLLIGLAILLSIGVTIVHYLLIYPALHDWPIHQGYTFDDTPQYGGAQTFHTKGIDILLFIVAMVLILGIHYPITKYLLKYKFLTSGICLITPGIYYFTIWLMLSKQITPDNFYDKTGIHFWFGVLISGGFLLVVILILLWRLTLIGTQPMPTEK